MRWLFSLSVLLCTLLGMAATASAAGPTLAVDTPPDGMAVGTTVQVTLHISGMTVITSTVPLNEAGKHPEVNRPGQGHIHYILDLRPLAVQYQDKPIVLTDVPTGQHTLMVELVNNDHSSLSPPVMQQIQFQTVPGSLPSSGGGGMAAPLPGGMAAPLPAGVAVLLLVGAALAAETARRRRA